MKYLAALLLCLFLLPARAQQPRFAVHKLRLPPEVAYYDNQFSGLSISAGRLLLLSESRLQDNAEAKLYAVPLPELTRQLADSTFAPTYQKLPLVNLPVLRAKINAERQAYEGLEALLIDQQTVYLSVETATPSSTCYLLRGTLGPAAVVLDTTFLLPLAKPLAADGSRIYNAGFEALAAANREVFAFYEFNDFPGANYVYGLAQPLTARTPPQRRALPRLPFRLTDVTPVGSQRFVGINYFFKGEGGDAVYRTPAADTASTRLITDQGGFKNYCRLVTIEWKNNKFSWRPLWEFPEQYRSYNWEGLAAYQGGYFVINDKYTPSRPYQTTLLYLAPLGN